MDWVIGSILGTSLVVLVLCAVKIISMKGEVERLQRNMEHVLHDRNNLGYYDSTLKRVELWSAGKEAIWKAVEERMIYELRVGRRYIPHIGTTEGFPINKVLDKLLVFNGVKIEEVLTDGFELKKVKKK